MIEGLLTLMLPALQQVSAVSHNAHSEPLRLAQALLLPAGGNVLCCGKSAVLSSRRMILVSSLTN
jgi:hypothetical protein